MKAHHAAVFGDSGEGKTAILKEFQSHCGWPVIISDHSEGDGSGKYPASDKLATLSGMRDRVANWDEPTDKVIVHHSSSLSPKEHAANVAQIARDILDTYGVPVAVIYDEAHRVLAGDWDEPGENPVAWCLHEARDLGIKCIVATQDPQDLPYGPLKQCQTLTWVGRPAGFHGPFLSHSISDAIDKDTVYEQDQYEYTVFDKRGHELYADDTVAYE